MVCESCQDEPAGFNSLNRARRMGIPDTVAASSGFRDDAWGELPGYNINRRSWPDVAESSRQTRTTGEWSVELLVTAAVAPVYNDYFSRYVLLFSVCAI